MRHSVNVRCANEEDVPALVELGFQMHQEGAYAFLPFDREKVRRFILNALERPDSNCVLVAEEEGLVIGMLGGYVSDYFFCDERLACDTAFFVQPGHRSGVAAAKLVRAFRDWAVTQGAREVCLAISSGTRTERVGRFYEHLGLRSVGGVYKQRLGEASAGDARC
jgi:GNAT superfamily N-acetyltransferase